jgi:hypothetical protein
MPARSAWCTQASAHTRSPDCRIAEYLRWPEDALSARLQFDEVIGLWLDGQRRLAAADPAERAALERVTDAIVDELRRRLSVPFTTTELASLYGEQGTDWCFEIATRVAPNTPAAWDLTTVAGAAFARYVREASDYGGGRRIVGDEP